MKVFRRQHRRIYSEQMSQKGTHKQNSIPGLSSDLYMKKLLLLSAIVLGAVSASQAGIRFNIGFGLPLPVPPVAVVAAPAPVCAPTPIVTAAPVCEPAPVVVAPQICEQPVVVAPRSVIVRHPVYERHYDRNRHYASARWDYHRGR